jgi:hypothetical protein
MLRRARLELLTEIYSVGIEHSQADKLLGDLRPSGDDESEEVSALEDGPGPNLRVDLSSLAFYHNGGGHNLL